MLTSHILGFPRIGQNRELKTALESYWQGKTPESELFAVGDAICEDNWQRQLDAGLSFISVGDFSYYDHMLDHSFLFGALPSRCSKAEHGLSVIDQLFAAARGKQVGGDKITPSKMKKWFNTNYHYIVPELKQAQNFKLNSQFLLERIEQATQFLAHKDNPGSVGIKPVIVGPLSFLYLSQMLDDSDPLLLLDQLLPCYHELIFELKAKGIEWLQIDEPILALNLPPVWQQAISKVYQYYSFSKINVLLSTYFNVPKAYLQALKDTHLKGLHIDAANGDVPQTVIAEIAATWPQERVLSLGVISGRNIWRTDFSQVLPLLQPIYQQRDNKLWLGSSCSLLHVPIDQSKEKVLAPQISNALSFANQKLSEIVLLAQAVTDPQNEKVVAQIKIQQDCLKALQSLRDQLLLDQTSQTLYQPRQTFAVRQKAQQSALKLPILPTTTIGSFPQTTEVRKLRADYKNKRIDEQAYQQGVKAYIKDAIWRQEELGLDVLVHGEPERNDMVEYFGELLTGMVTTQHGWVQSYGSRCVKPPVIYADVSRAQPMTVEWITYAQSLSKKPVKGMLTGPVTILAWSFVRDDKPLPEIANQIAYALRAEVEDLQTQGIKVVQIDEPALREKLPLDHAQWQDYFNWAVKAFKIAASGAAAQTQIHTHMCYSEFNDIIEQIAALDADVITIESTRSHMEILKSFRDFNYPNEIGPGVYDIHSPNIPVLTEMADNIKKALAYIPANRLWVNPDCGLKTRTWPEVSQALENMVAAAITVRQTYKNVDSINKADDVAVVDP